MRSSENDAKGDGYKTIDIPSFMIGNALPDRNTGNHKAKIVSRECSKGAKYSNNKSSDAVNP